MTGMGPRLGKGNCLEDLTLYYLVAIFLVGLPSSRWFSPVLLVAALGSFHFLVIGIVCSLAVMNKSLPAGGGDFRENPAFWCPVFLLTQNLLPRPFSGKLLSLGRFRGGP